ncbi:MAG: tRNA (N(6)-L-threonylcarbamoyladenosine(37)-C(2))-methylthiotransferase MtaB [Saccharofermentanales bacterium]
MPQETRNLTVAIHTLGCKVNQYESDAVAGKFASAGYSLHGFHEKCDIYIINTCTVTGEAGRKSRQFIHRARAANPDAVVVAMGCHTEVAGNAEYADIVLGSRNKQDVVKIVEEHLAIKSACAYAGIETDGIVERSHFFLPGNALGEGSSGESGYEEMGTVASHEISRAFIKIEDGCNNFCSYCIIPYARGRVRSRDEETILREARELALNGFREIVLTGIHICSYGADRGGNSEALAELVCALSAIDGIDRIRLGSLEPDSVTPRFIEKIASSDKLCPHFHISLQSGSDSVLARMNRRYDSDGFRRMAEQLRSRIPDATITTDIITGFPGETDAEHSETMKFCAEMDFMNMHVFKYSRREGTRAAKMNGMVPAGMVNLRSKELIGLAADMRRSHFAASSGRCCKVLVETVNGSVATGYTENYMPVRIDLPQEYFDDHSLIGTIRNILTTSYTDEAITAKFDIMEIKNQMIQIRKETDIYV